jgi:hypothetical protein
MKILLRYSGPVKKRIARRCQRLAGYQAGWQLIYKLINESIHGPAL